MGFLDFLKRKKNDDDDEEDFSDFDEDRSRTQVIDDTELSEKTGDDINPESGSEDSSSYATPDPGTTDDDFEIPDFDDEEEDASKEGGRAPMLFVIIGAAVLFIGVVGGVGFWFLGSDDDDISIIDQLEEPTRGKSVSMAIPPRIPRKDGGLNAVDQNDHKPVESVRGAETNVQDQAASSEQAVPRPGLGAITGGTAAGSLNVSVGQIQPNTGQGLVIPSVTSVSYRKLPDQDKIVPLATAPDLLLIESVAGFLNPLPITGADGRKPWQVYARPSTSKTNNPKVAFLVKGLGYSRAATMAAIKKLPGQVSLAFSPYVEDLNDWMLRARLSGHEVFLELPMESRNFPVEDAGPLALNTNFQVADNIKQLNQVMSRMTGYVGLLSVMGSKFNEAEGQLKPILAEIKKRGLMFVDGGGSWSRARRIAAQISLPKAYPNVYLDQPPSRQAMEQKLLTLNKLAHSQGVAVAIVHAYPNTIEKLLSWIRSMEDRKLTLVPVSAIANKQIVQ